MILILVRCMPFVWLLSNYCIYLGKRHILNSSRPWLVATMHIRIMVINATAFSQVSPGYSQQRQFV